MTKKNNQYLNMFTLDSQDELDCYSTYFTNPYQICSSYFQNSFDSFLLDSSKTWLVSKDKQQLKSEYYILYDNSLSKKEFLDESDRDVDIATEVIFSMDNFDDYHGHLLSSSFVIHQCGSCLELSQDSWSLSYSGNCTNCSL